MRQSFKVGLFNPIQPLKAEGDWDAVIKRIKVTVFLDSQNFRKATVHLLQTVTSVAAFSSYMLQED